MRLYCFIKRCSIFNEFDYFSKFSITCQKKIEPIASMKFPDPCELYFVLLFLYVYIWVIFYVGETNIIIWTRQ